MVGGRDRVALAVIAATLYWPSKTHAKLKKQDTIVIADFDNKTGEGVFDDTLRLALSIQMEQSPFLNVLSDDKVGEALTLMQRHPGERMGEKLAREVCLRSNSQALLAGRVASIGDRYLIELRALTCQTGDTLASSEAQAENRNQVLGSLSKLASELREELGESLGSIQNFNQPLEQVTTSSLEALQAYTKGSEVVKKNGPFEAIPYFKRAVELDPNFAIAYSGLGASYGQLYENAMKEQNVAKAYELRFRTSLRERFMIESTYYWDMQGDMGKAVTTYTEWIQYYPDDSFPHYELARANAVLGQWEKAADEARAAVRLTPTVDSYLTLVAAYIAMNRREDAKAVFREAEQRNIDGYLLRQYRYYLAFMEGDVATMKAEDAWAAGKPVIEAYQHTLQSSVEAYHGHFTKARDLMNEAESEAARAQAKAAVDIIRAIHGPTEADVGHAEAALRCVERGWTSTSKKTDIVAPMAALTLALAGKRAEAQTLVAEMDKDSQRDTITQSYTLPVIRAAMAIQANDPLKAIELLKAAGPYELGDVDMPPNALYPAYIRGVAYLKAGQGQPAAAEFQKVMDHPGVTLLHIQGALARLGLARAYALEARTDPAVRDKARTAYQNFLTLWKDADPDIPIYKQAKGEYAKLQ